MKMNLENKTYIPKLFGIFVQVNVRKILNKIFNHKMEIHYKTPQRSLLFFQALHHHRVL